MLWSAVLAGVFLQQFWAARKDPNRIAIESIHPRMTGSFVSVEGVLISDARRMNDGRTLLVVDDETGRLPLFIPDLTNLPKTGSRVWVTGRLNAMSGKNSYLQVFGGDDLVAAVVPPIDSYPGPTRLADISAAQSGRWITLYGYVTSVAHSQTGLNAPHEMVIEDPGGRLEVIYWFDASPRIALGDPIKVRGRLELFRDQVQLKVFRSADMTILKYP